MVVLSNLGAYGTLKCSSWCADIHKSKDPEYTHPEIQHSKTPKIQKSKNPKLQKSKNQKIIARFRRCKKFWISGFWDFWIFGFLDFWVFGFLDFLCFTLVFPICRNSSKLGFGKNGVCIGVYSVFKGCACRREGGDHMCVCVCF